MTPRLKRRVLRLVFCGVPLLITAGIGGTLYASRWPHGEAEAWLEKQTPQLKRVEVWRANDASLKSVELTDPQQIHDLVSSLRCWGELDSPDINDSLQTPSSEQDSLYLIFDYKDPKHLPEQLRLYPPQPDLVSMSATTDPHPNFSIPFWNQPVRVYTLVRQSFSVRSGFTERGVAQMKAADGVRFRATINALLKTQSLAK